MLNSVSILIQVCERASRVSQLPNDIIFMDIQMPILNGYDAAREIRASGKERIDELPIIAMTADAFAEDVKHAGLSGMNGHLAKPISIERLREALSNCLSWKLHNQGSSPSCDEF